MAYNEGIVSGTLDLTKYKQMNSLEQYDSLWHEVFQKWRHSTCKGHCIVDSDYKKQQN